MEIEFVCNQLFGTGYGTHAGNVLVGFIRRGVNIKMSSKIRYNIYKYTPRTICEFVEKSKSSVLHNPIYLYVTVPNLVQMGKCDRTVNYTVFETDKICKDWCDVANSIRMTIVPTRFSYNTWINSGVKKDKVCYIPEGVDTDIFNINVKPMDLLYRGVPLRRMFKHIFIVQAQYTARKNIDGLLSIFIKAFEGEKDVCLLIKTNIDGSSLGLYRHPLEKANIFLYEADLPEEIIARFLMSGTHYLSLSHGEGWDLNCSNMCALGKTIVVPRYSAYEDYLDDSMAFLIEGEKTPAIQSHGFQNFYQGSFWWEPDVDDAVSKLRESVVGNNDDKRTRCYKNIVENYTWDLCVAKLLEVLKPIYREGC